MLGKITGVLAQTKSEASKCTSNHCTLLHCHILIKKKKKGQFSLNDVLDEAEKLFFTKSQP